MDRPLCNLSTEELKCLGEVHQRATTAELEVAKLRMELKKIRSELIASKDYVAHVEVVRNDLRKELEITLKKVAGLDFWLSEATLHNRSTNKLVSDLRRILDNIDVFR